jgi:cytoskeletal protein CcmA (bactofilin family)
MNNQKKGHVLLLTFILLTALSFIVGSFIYLTTGGIKNMASLVSREKAFYLAEAGLQKAIWYLNAPPEQGGYGISWRTSGSSESLAGGSYTMKVNQLGSDLIITAEGNYRNSKRTLQVRYNTYPPSFSYAIFSQQRVQIDDGVVVGGDLFADANVQVNNNARVTGKVIVTAGHSVSGSGTYTAQQATPPIPTLPTLETTFYNGEIARTAGSTDYSRTGVLNLSGSTIYGRNITVQGRINGPGALVAGQKLTIDSDSSIGDGVKLISDKELNIKSNSTFGQNITLYSNSKIDIDSNASQVGPGLALLSPRQLEIDSNSNLSGIIYAAKIDIGSTSIFRGSIQGGASTPDNHFDDNSQIIFDRAKFPSTPPTGLSGGFSLVKDSWKEL